MIKRYLSLLFLVFSVGAFFAGALTGCGDDDDDNTMDGGGGDFDAGWNPPDAGVEDGGIVDNSLTWVEIPGGTYTMNKGTVANVSTFEILQTEVTVAQYAACVDAEFCTAPATSETNCNWGQEVYLKHAVNCVDWFQSTDYCAAVGGRLLKESEWEYAARSRGQAINYPWGDETATCEYAVMAETTSGCGTARPWEVCSKPDGNSEQGVCDMAGNVYEWILDTDNNNPAHRVTRGGSFGRPAVLLMNSVSESQDPTYWDTGHGIRCALDR